MTDFNLRNATLDDAKAILSIYSPYITDTAVSFECETPAVSEFRMRIENTLTKFPYLVAEKDGQVIGYAYAGPFRKRAAYECSAELSVYINKEFHGKGIGRALYSELEKRLKDQGISAIYACIASSADSNDPYLTDASPEFHKHCGWKLCGTFTRCAKKFNRWYDIIYMEKHI